MNQSADLLVGDAGEAVRDLQARLSAVGFDVPSDELGRFGECTLSAVRAFQRSRGLLADGTCGRQTWSALVESGFTLGDRMLYVRQPMLRGDDVAALQRGLNRLGFDAGREDGIFGPDTATALTEFQRNAGLAPDAICGSATLGALSRLGTLAAGSVAAVREREMLRRGPHGLDGRRVYVMAAPGFEALGDAVARGLLERGADTLLDASGDEASLVAAAANQFEAELFLALRAGDAPGCRCSYFASASFRSEAGFRVAGAVQEELSSLLGCGRAPSGRAYAVLRETRMAAVACELAEQGDVAATRQLVANAGDVSRAIVRGVERGVEVPADD